MFCLRSLTSALLLSLLISSGRAAEPSSKEADYYEITTMPIPPGVALEAGALELLPGNVLAVADRRGEIYLVDKPSATDPKQVTPS